MTTLSADKVKKFRDKLFQKRVSKLLQKGGKGLKPLDRYRKDEKGRTLVPVDKIIRFFSKEMEKAGAFHPDQYFDGLFTLFKVLSQGAEPFTFECGFSVSEQDIQQADIKTTIELLTKNLIITYFSNLKTIKDQIDTGLLTPDLASIIQKSNAGRDYRDLVGNTLTKLISSLGQDKPWREYLDDINDADLVCRLTGAKLPSMKKEILAGIILKSRKEIQAYNAMFRKVINTREQMAEHEKNDKKYLKAMQRLDEATQAILKKIDTYMEAAHSFMKIIGLTTEAVLGKTDGELKENLTRLFLGFKPGTDDLSDILTTMGFATARYRLNMLFGYPDIALYSRAFRVDDRFRGFYYDLFRLLFRELKEKIEQLPLDGDETLFRLFKQNLSEAVRAVDTLALEPEDLVEEKYAVRDAYVALVQEISYEKLGAVLDTRELVCLVTQDRTREIMAPIRSALLKNCFSTLGRYAEEPLAADRAKNGIRKRLHYFALHYKPQRAFYQLFFATYVGKADSALSPYLSQFMQKNKHFVFALLMLFSDENSMHDLLAKNQISHARTLLEKLRKAA